MKQNIMNSKEIICASVITLLLAAFDLLGYPAALFVDIVLADVNPVYFTLIINQWFLIAVGLTAIHLLCPSIRLRLKKEGLKEGLKKFWVSGMLLFSLSLLAYYIGFTGNYDYKPSVWKIFIEGFVYYLSVGFIEELYIRGLLLNIIERLCINRKNAVFIAIVVSACIFSLGHIPGMIGENQFTIICRLIWTMSLGVYFGVIYKKTNNLWVPIIMHILVNVFSGMLFCFTTQRTYPQITVILVTVTYLIIGAWSVRDFFKPGE